MNLSAVATPYVVAFGLSALVSYWVGFHVRRRYDAPGTRSFVGVFVTIGAYATVSAAHVLFADSLFVTRLAIALELTLATIATVLWFSFASTYGNRDFHEWRSVRVALAGLVVGTFVLTATSQLHPLVVTELVPVGEPFAHYEIGKGPAHYAITLLAYLPFLAGVAVMVAVLRSTPYLWRALVALTVGAVALGVSNLLPYVVAVPIAYSPLYMPLGAAACAGLGAIAIHYNLFTVTPVARQSVVTAIRDPIVTLDTDRRVTDLNPAFLETFVDGPARDVLGRPFEAVVPALAADVSFDDYDDPQHVAWSTASAPATRHFSVTVSVVTAGPHRIGETLVFRDVTEATQSRRELERQNAQLDEFAVSAAHNLRNPLAIVSGYTDVLESHLLPQSGRSDRPHDAPGDHSHDAPGDHSHDAPGDRPHDGGSEHGGGRGAGTAGGDASARVPATYDPAFVRRCLDKLQGETDRMDDIITDFLRVMRDGKTVTSTEPVGFSSAIRHALNAVETPRDVDLTVEPDGAVHADPARLMVLLRAVLRSATDRAGGPVSVDAGVTADGFVIEDHSGTISEEDCELLLTHGTSPKYRTTGLGLSVAKTLAAVHRWDVAAEPGEDGLRVVVTAAETTLDTDQRPGWVTLSDSS